MLIKPELDHKALSAVRLMIAGLVEGMFAVSFNYKQLEQQNPQQSLKAACTALSYVLRRISYEVDLERNLLSFFSLRLARDTPFTRLAFGIKGLHLRSGKIRTNTILHICHKSSSRLEWHFISRGLKILWSIERY